MDTQRAAGLRTVRYFALLAGLQASFVWGADDAAPIIAANEAIQAQIRDVVAAMRGKDEEATFRAWAALLKTAHRDQPEMVRQLLHYDWASPDETAATMLPATILHGNISRMAMLEAILPLMGSNDSKTKSALSLLTGIIEDYSAKDFSYYESYLRAQVEPEPQLVEHMYNVSPSNALMVFMRLEFVMETDKQKPILWADHVISDAVWKEFHKFTDAAAAARLDALKELTQLAARKEWWARLYVARILKQHEYLRSPELLAKLEKDEHALVRKLIAERVEKRSPR